MTNAFITVVSGYKATLLLLALSDSSKALPMQIHLTTATVKAKLYKSVTHLRKAHTSTPLNELHQMYSAHTIMHNTSHTSLAWYKTTNTTLLYFAIIAMHQGECATNHHSSGPTGRGSWPLCVPRLCHPLINTKHSRHHTTQWHHSYRDAESRQSLREVTHLYPNKAEVV